MATPTKQSKHRPPHATFKIIEMIKLNKHDEAQRCTDENVAFYDQKIAEQQDLYILAQCRKMGLEPNKDNLFATAINTPKRRMPRPDLAETAKRLGEAGAT